MKHYLYYHLFIPFLIIFIILLSSRTASTVTIITVLAYFVLTFKKQKMNFREKIFSAALIALVFSFQLLVLNIYNRFSDVKSAIQSASELQPDNHRQDQNGAAARIYLWRNAVELIDQHLFFGVGVGDVKDELMKVYAKNNYQNGIEKKLNPHNQYLQTTIALGIPGLCVLVWIMAVALWKSLKRRHWISFLFVTIVALNCLTESILERQAGIIFFTLFYVLLLNFHANPVRESLPVTAPEK